MTDRTDALRIVGEQIGAEATDQLAEAVLDVLEDRGYVLFDADGYSFRIPEWNDDGASWNEILSLAEKSL